MNITAHDRRWKKPADKPMPDLAQDRPAEGNRTILVIVDRRRPDFKDVHTAALAALGHMGLPYRIWDIGARQLPEQVVQEQALILLAQEHLGGSLSPQSTQAILAGLKAGTGLFSLDPWLMAYPGNFARTLQLGNRNARAIGEIRLRTNRHYIGALRDDNETVRFRKSVFAAPLTGQGTVLLAAHGAAFMRAGQVGAGRVVWLGLSPKIWFHEYLGHGQGLDDMFWRSIAWVAKKPFAMKAMPPYVSMRFDDSSGLGGLWWIIGNTNSLNIPHSKPLARIINREPAGKASVLNHFNYVKALNDFGWKPEISLFVDQVSDEDWRHLKTIYDKNNVQPSLHGSFRDGFDEEGQWFSDFVMYKGVECLTPKGVVVKSCLAPAAVHLYMEKKNQVPYRIARYSDRVLEKRMRRLDAIWKTHGIIPGSTVNNHWRNVPSNALRFLKERGQTFMITSGRCNYVYVDPEAYAWRLLPYGVSGMFMDYLPIPADARGVNPGDFFNFGGHIYARMANDPVCDNVDFCRGGKEPIAGILTHRDPELIARKIIRHTKLGLQSLFFGFPVTHELNLATFTQEEWRDILQAVDAGLRHYPKTFVLADEIARAARSKCETHIDIAQCRGGALHLALSGKAEADIWLRIFHDQGDDCTERLQKLAPFDGTKQVVVR